MLQAPLAFSMAYLNDLNVQQTHYSVSFSYQSLIVQFNSIIGRQIKISPRLFSESHLYDPCMSLILLLFVICRLSKKMFKPI